MRRPMMHYSMLTLTLLSAVAVAAPAQVVIRRDTVSRERVRVREPGRTFVSQFGPEGFQFDLRRGRMGINVDLRPDAARDSLGARVAGVTPGGPAERAGVQTGDIITRVNGTRLTATTADERDRDEDWEDQSRPAMRLLRIAARLDPGDTVRLDVRRGTQNQTFTFVAEASDMDRVMERMPMLQELGEPREGGPMRLMISGAGPSDLELVRINPGLGEYFGTGEGLLVVDVGSDTALGLRAGDVILSVGGRRPSSPAHAMRILSTYEGGEVVQFDVMRQRRRISVSGRMPQAGRWRVQHNSLEVPQFDHFRNLEPLMEHHLEPLMDEMRHFRQELPRLRLHMQGPEIRMRMHGPEVQIQEQTSLLKTDGWT